MDTVSSEVSLQDQHVHNGYLLARVATGNSESAMHLLQKALKAFSCQVLVTDPSYRQTKFFLLLEGAIIDWRIRQRILQLFHLKSKLDQQPIGEPDDQHGACFRLQELPLVTQQSFLLHSLAHMNPKEVADILSLEEEQVQHPLYRFSKGETEQERQMSYRRLLRSHRRAVRQIPKIIDGQLYYQLEQIKKKALANPLHPEHLALYFWQQALARKFKVTSTSLVVVTGIAVLIASIFS